MSDDEKTWDLRDFHWHMSVTTKIPIEMVPPPHKFEVVYRYPTPEMPDGDYTADCLEAGTTFTIEGALHSDPIPVESWVVEDGVSIIKGHASWAQGA